MDYSASLPLALALVNALTGLQPANDSSETLRYIRWSGAKFVTESTIERQRKDGLFLLKSITTRPGMTLTLCTKLDPMDRLVEAQVTIEQGMEKRAAHVTVREKTAHLRRADGMTSELECPPGVIVTSAPDWTDAVCLVRRYDRTRQDKQEFAGLWIHPTQEPNQVRFIITRLGSDPVERDGQTHNLDRFLIQLRGGSRYIAWGDERGRLVRLHPDGRPAQGTWLEGWEHARGPGWPDHEQSQENDK